MTLITPIVYLIPRIRIRTVFGVLVVALLLWTGGSSSRTPAMVTARGTAVAAPVLKWQHGGCYSSWCETGWYSSPAVADLDGDGSQEVIGGTYSLFVLNGEDGSTQWSVDPAGGRVWPGVVVADLDNDGDPEIVTAHGGGYLHVHDHTGNTVWSRQPAGNELRGLAVYDLDADDTMEIVVTGAVYGKTNTWVYEHDGTLRPGWPQLSNESGYAYGVFNDNAAVGDLGSDGVAEIVVPSDMHYICAYESNGDQIPAHAMYGDKGWGRVGVWDWNLETNEIYVDPILKALLGYEDHEIRNELDDWGSYVHPDDQERVGAAAEAHLSGKTPTFEVEHRMAHRDGSIRWIIARGKAERNSKGEPVRVLGTDTDITDLKLAEQKLHEQLSELQRWQDVTLEREDRILGLKHEVNELLNDSAQPPRYPSAEE